MSWAKLAAERRRAVAEASRTPPTPPPGKVCELQPESGSGGAGAGCQSALVTPGQMSNVPTVPNTLCRQGSRHAEVEEVSPFGTFGAVGFFGAGKSGARPVIAPLQFAAKCGPLPEPEDLAERAAILEADGVHREAAETQALQEVGLPSWETYAMTLAARLGSQVEAVAGVRAANRLERHWQALVRHSLSFLASPWWPLACRHGWGLTELFGLDCGAALVRVDGWGLAIAPALSSLPPTRLVELTCEGAAFATQSGSLLSWPRFFGQPEHTVPWWELANNAGSSKS